MLRRRPSTACVLEPIWDMAFTYSHPLSQVGGDKGASMQSTIFNLVNTTIGAGLLCLPYAMQLNGMVSGAVILCIIAWAAGKSANMLAVCLEHTGAPSYGDLAMSVWGERGKRIVELTNCTCSFGMMCGYTCIIGDILAPVFVNLLSGPPPPSLKRSPVIAIVSTFILLPLSSLEHMSSLAASSYFAFAFVVFFVCCVTIKTLVLSPFPEFAADYSGSTPKAVFFRYDIVAYMRSAPIVFTAFLNHMNVPILYNDLSAAKLPSEPNCFRRFGSKLARMGMATSVALLICLVLSIIVGEFGYIYFRNNTTSNVLKDYEPSKLIDVMRVAYALVLSTCFPLQAYGCRKVLHRAIFGKDVEATTLHRWVEAFFLLIFSTTVAVLVTDLGVILGLTGSTAGCAIMYIFPGAFYRAYALETGASPLQGTLFVACGCFAGLAGSIVTLIGN
ncbi:amino acid transporter [bacterium]|nr:amino acid transporter [bacterium]